MDRSNPDQIIDVLGEGALLTPPQVVALQPKPEAQITSPTELSVVDLKQRFDKIGDLYRSLMAEGIDYGVIPGTQKPTLLKPGAEKLGLLFRLYPSYHTRQTFDGQHLTVHSVCQLIHIQTGEIWGQGEGLCTTKEKKYAVRTAKRTCPSCGLETIMKGKAEYGGGWICWKKNGGCGAKFPDNAPEIAEQEAGTVANDSLADQWNTALKMANKRARVDATLAATGASMMFTQDLEDMDDLAGAAVATEPPKATAPPPKKPGRPPKPKPTTPKVVDDETPPDDIPF